MKKAEVSNKQLSIIHSQCKNELNQKRLSLSELDIPEGYPLDPHNVQAAKQVSRSIHVYKLRTIQLENMIKDIEDLQERMINYNLINGKTF
jgi:hypothetical protein